MIESYITNIKQQFNYYKQLGEKTFDQLNEEDIHWQYNSESNSIAIIVNHLRGNMMSRWTDFFTSDGEKEWRERDMEFEDVIRTKEEMVSKWSQGWECLFAALDTINKDNFDQVVYIRNMGHTIPEAVNRQLAHYSYHVGQIVFIGRMIRGSEWKNLSVPKGGSKQFNREKFEKAKRKEHFTKDLLDDSAR